jgi:phosphoribosyl-ATP pyrophosphohydrolase/phosphoribosyl-AMP cyclohydrolase/histidinol dehydrogenase
MSQPLLRPIRSEELRERSFRAVDHRTVAAARVILDDIDARGDAAVLEHARRLGDLREGEPFAYTPESLAQARDRLPVDQLRLLERTADRIRSFARAQRACLTDLALPIPGGRAGHTFIPVGSAGCYAPGGRFPLPSSVLMTAITARAAGVQRVWVASPKPTEVTLAAASVAGADGLLAIGGVQAIGALARGLLGAPKGGCDVIVGPGNRWVTAAKFLVSGEVGIDMLAGPSELLVLADETAEPALIAADLLAQAEHDDDAVPMLVTTDPTLPPRVDAELRRQLATLPTAPTASASIRNGFTLVAASLDEAIELVDRVAPEHLEVMTTNAREVSNRIANAGAVFIGSRSAEVLGDYGAGPNHVLPTGGTARFRAGLSVLSFLRARTWLEVQNPTAARPLTQDAADLARLERLEGHARSAQARASHD